MVLVAIGVAAALLVDFISLSETHPAAEAAD
jgi:hypothetical protein